MALDDGISYPNLPRCEDCICPDLVFLCQFLCLTPGRFRIVSSSSRTWFLSHLAKALPKPTKVVSLYPSAQTLQTLLMYLCRGQG